MKTIMLALTDPLEGQEDAYNRWYDDQHLSDVLGVEGFVAAQRFEVIGGATDAPHRYLAIYEVEDGQAEAAQAGLARARAEGTLVTSDTLAPGSDLWIYSAITDRRVPNSSGGSVE